MTPRGSGYTRWEGNQKNCRFSSGVTFAEAIDGDAQSRAENTYAGYASPFLSRLHARQSVALGMSLIHGRGRSWGWNGKSWSCYKSDSRWIFRSYQPEAATGCQRIYHCLPA